MATAYVNGYQPYTFADFSGGLSGRNHFVESGTSATDVGDVTGGDAISLGQFVSAIAPDAGLVGPDLCDLLDGQNGVQTAMRVLPTGDDLEVVGVHARPVPAQMVELVAIGDWAPRLHVEPAMSENVLAVAPGHSVSPLRQDGTLPHPAAVLIDEVVVWASPSIVAVDEAERHASLVTEASIVEPRHGGAFPAATFAESCGTSHGGLV